MNKHLRFIYLLLLVFLFNNTVVVAQNSFASEDELKQQAAKLFDDDSFEEAYPLYSQLLSLYPKSASYNFRFGVCMLYSIDDKEKPLSYLEFASRQADVEKEVFYYLGKAYHLNYRFDDAITQFQAFKKVASGSSAAKLDIDRQIEMCNNGKKLLRNLTDLVVLDKKEMSRADFFRSYDVTEIGGKLLVKPDEENFKTAIDKKKKEQSIIYLASNNNQIYFSSYGKSDKEGKDIYLIKKLPSGEWSKPKTLGAPINTKYDEDYPFLHPNGKVLYFCSKGHNSMGGYDIFKSILDEGANTWSEPVNLDFPINTPDDDILYVTDADEKEAYFSSARASLTGKIAVYHINAERKPIDVAIIKGSVVKNRDNQSVEAKITIKDANDNTMVGIYNSKAESGDYVLNLPNGGKYLFTVEAAGFPIQSQLVVLPPQLEFKPLKQLISYEQGTDKLVIKNMFDGVIDDANYLNALALIKEKSKMEVSTVVVENTTPETSVNNRADTTNAYFKEKNGFAVNENKSAEPNKTLTNNDIIKIAYDDAKDVAAEAKDIREQADIALDFANQKNESAQDKAKEAAQLTADAASIQDNVKKQATLDEANAAGKESEQLNQETVAAFNLAKRLDMNAKAKQEEADLSQKYATDLEAAVKSKNSTDAFAKLDIQQKKLDELSQKNTASDNIANSLKNDADRKQKQLNDATQDMIDIKEEMADNKKVIETTKADIEKTKDEKLKNGLTDQLAGLEQDNIDKQKELDQKNVKIAQLQKEYNGIKNETELISSVLDVAKTGTNESAAEKVATIDKTKLEQQVNTINNTAPAATTTTVAVNQTKVSTEDNASVVPSGSKNITEDTNANTQLNENKIKTETNTASASKVNNNVVTPPSKDNFATPTDEALQNSPNSEAITALNKNHIAELGNLDKIENEVVREKLKAEILKNWADELTADIEKQKAELEKTSDPKLKDALTKKIQSEETLAKEKQSFADKSVAKAETINQQKPTQTNTIADNSVVNNSASSAKDNVSASTITDNTSDNSAASTNNTVSKSITSSTTKDNIAADNYSSTVKNNTMTEDNVSASTTKDNATDNATSVKAKDNLPANTSTTKDNIVTDNSSSSTTKDNTTNESTASTTAKDNIPANTSTTKDNIVTDNSSSTAKDNSTVENNVSTSTTKENTTNEITAPTKAKDNLPATASTVQKNTNSEVITTINKKYTDELASAEQITNETNREKAKAETLKNWSDEINKDIEKQKLDLSATINPEEKTVLSQKINDAESLSKEKQTLADVSIAKVENIKQQNTIAAATHPVVNKNESTAENSNNENAKNTSHSYENKTVYTNPIAKDQVEKANTYTKEAEDLVVQSNNIIKQIADQTDETKKTEMYAQSMELIKQSDEKKILAAQNLTKGNEIEFIANSNELDKLIKTTPHNSSGEFAVAEAMNDDAKNHFEKSQKLRMEADSSSSIVIKEMELEEANRNEEIALDKQQKSIAIYKKNNSTVISSNEVTPAVNTASSVSPVNNAVTEKTIDTLQNNSATVSPVAIANEVFERKAIPAYSEKKPIPVNEKLPDGLIFKVQIGAFAKPIPQDLFAGMSPITGETTPQGYIRYTAGLFVNYANADKIKNEIKGLGYKDAFVVAFLNGKRISVNEARQRLSGNSTVAASTENNNSVNAINPPAGVQTDNAKPGEINVPAISNGKEDVTTLAKAESVTTVGGLFYTVQVGVYSQPVTSKRLYNLDPLYSEKAPNGYLRYNTGIYNNIPRASEAKEMVNDVGIKDAYITAYYNGKRITMTEAKKIEEQGTSVFSTAPNLNRLPTFNALGSKNTSTLTSEVTAPVNPNLASSQVNKTDEQNNSQLSETGVIYKVQIGAFNEEVPLEIANIFITIANKGIKNYKEESGLTIYTIGNYQSYDEANKSKAEVINAGVTGAFVVAYKDGKKISITDAKAFFNK
jgi:hypothetical protein